MPNHPARHASWRDLLAAPPSASHIVQLCDSDVFLADAVALFAAEGLRGGEAVHLIGTPEHLRAIQRQLAFKEVDVVGAIRDGRLRLGDAHAALEAMLRDGLPDQKAYHATAGATLAAAMADPRFSGVRVWGELTCVLHQAGNVPGAIRMEELSAEAVRKHGVKVLCSFQCNRFHPRGYEGPLKDLCNLHSHVIPADDYVAHRLAVNRAVAEVVGDIRGPLLHSLLSWRGVSCDMPSSQALLFWIRETMPERFPKVLERASAYHDTDSGPS